MKFGRWRGRLTFVSDDGLVPVSAVIVAHRDRRGRDRRRLAGGPGPDRARGPATTSARPSARFAALVENVADLIAVARPRTASSSTLSPAASRILGYGDGELDGPDLLDLVHPDDAPADARSRWPEPDEQGIGAPVELRLRADRRLAGATSRSSSPTSPTTRPSAASCSTPATSPSGSRRCRRWPTKAYTDPLTGLPNRCALLDRLASGAGATRRRPVVIVLLVDSTASRASTRLLGRERRRRDPADGRRPAARGRGRRRPVRRPPGRRRVRRRARRRGATVDARASSPTASAQAVAEPIELDGGAVDVTASASASPLAGRGDEPDELLHDAERAMARAKERGRRPHSSCSRRPAGRGRRAAAATVEQQLRQALDHDGVRVHYQPIVDIETEQHRRRRGPAAGARRGRRRCCRRPSSSRRPSPRASSPASGRRSCRSPASSWRRWAARAGGGSPDEISVNVSPRQLADPGPPAAGRRTPSTTSRRRARAALASRSPRASSSAPEPTIDASISYLRALGVRIGLDDFGAGQSSLGYLKRFPLDFVKIDRSLIAGLGVNEHDTAIVRATIELAHNLGPHRRRRRASRPTSSSSRCRSSGCDRAQGYLFAPALPADEFSAEGRHRHPRPLELIRRRWSGGSDQAGRRACELDDVVEEDPLRSAVVEVLELADVVERARACPRCGASRSRRSPGRRP